MSDFWASSVDGWIGAALGALVSIVVAVFVLRSTLKHDRDLFIEQIAHERSAGEESARLASFARLCEELLAVPGRLGATTESVFVAFMPAVAAWHVWATYMPVDHPLLLGVNRGIGEVRRKASKSVQMRGIVGSSSVDRMFLTNGGYDDIGWIVERARRWLLVESDREEVEAAFIRRFPPRSTTDLESGQDRTV